MKRMAGEVLDDVPVLMSGAGHDAMAMSHLTKVCCFFHFIYLLSHIGLLVYIKYFMEF